MDLPKVFKALSHETRWAILRLLASNDVALTQGYITQLIDSSEHTISHHLKELVNAQVLDRRQMGKFGQFSINRQTLTTLVTEVSEIMKLQKGEATS